MCSATNPSRCSSLSDSSGGCGGPFAEELQRCLAAAEIALFIQRGSVDDELLATAWYLHGVGSARVSLGPPCPAWPPWATSGPCGPTRLSA